MLSGVLWTVTEFVVSAAVSGCGGESFAADAAVR